MGCGDKVHVRPTTRSHRHKVTLLTVMPLRRARRVSQADGLLVGLSLWCLYGAYGVMLPKGAFVDLPDWAKGELEQRRGSKCE